MDQVIDRVTVGIPTDVEVVRNDVDAFRREADAAAEAAAASARSAASSESEATAQAAASRDSAEESREWAARRNLLVRAQAEEPQELFDGMLWLVTDESAEILTGIRRWDHGLAGSATWPAAATWPGTSAFPHDTGAWAQFRISPSLVATA